MLLSVWSVSSVVAGVLYGVRPWPRALHRRLPTLLIAFAALVPLLAVPDSLVGLGFALLVTGLLITPQATTHSMLIDVVAPPGTGAEAFGWVITAATLGLAAGQSVSGALVDWSGPASAFLAAAASGLLIGGVVLARRATLRPAPAPDTTHRALVLH